MRAMIVLGLDSGDDELMITMTITKVIMMILPAFCCSCIAALSLHDLQMTTMNTRRATVGWLMMMKNDFDEEINHLCANLLILSFTSFAGSLVVTNVVPGIILVAVVLVTVVLVVVVLVVGR